MHTDSLVAVRSVVDSRSADLEVSLVLDEQRAQELRVEVERQLSEVAAEEEEGDGVAMSFAEAEAQWQRLEVLTSALAAELTEQLRTILEPTLAARLSGDYRCGFGPCLRARNVLQCVLMCNCHKIH